MDKYISFEYFLKNIHDWYYEAFPTKSSIENDNDLSILKCLKLLFLATAAEIDEGDDRENLLIEDTFNKFYALPLGHVESEIYSHIKERNGELNYFNITKEKLLRNTTEFPIDFDDLNTERIEFAVYALKKRNADIIKLKAYELVDLTHKWASWRILYNKDLGSTFIPSSIIKSERKYFY